MEKNLFYSVLVCCYNSEKYISETIDSIINQTYKHWEIVIVNDGSTDSTENIIFNYINQNIPITYYKQVNQGLAAARNKGLELARGEWIAIIDHDDICLPNRLEIQARHIQTNRNAKLFFANTIHFNNENEIRRHYDRFNPCQLDLSRGKALNSLLVHSGFIDTESVVFHKETALHIGGFDTKYKFVVDDDFFKRVGSKFDIFAGEETVSKWRVHNNQATQKMENIIHQENINIFVKYFYFEGVTNRTRLRMIINFSILFLKNI